MLLVEDLAQACQSVSIRISIKAVALIVVDVCPAGPDFSDTGL